MRPGPLVAIGGAEDKLGRSRVLGSFVDLAGGPEAEIAVVATASSLGPEIVEAYDAVFTRLGARAVWSARPESRQDAEDPALADRLSRATGIFLTGGNQLKLSGVVAGTVFGEAIRSAHLRGATVGGTSAGASILSTHMVAFGRGGATPKQRMTQVAAGLGLVEGCVVDQHFEQRNRHGRLLSIVAQNPSLLGIGIDEDTAAVFSRGEDGRRLMSVAGRGSVTVLDGHRAISDAYEAARSRPLLVSGVMLHALPAGSVFDLAARALHGVPPAAQPPAAEPEGPAARRSLSHLSRDIAAGDSSPSTLRRRLARRSREGDPQ